MLLKAILSSFAFGMLFVPGCFPVSKSEYKTRMVAREDMDGLADCSKYSLKLLPYGMHLVNEK